MALGLVLGWATLTVYVLHAALPYNPIHLPFEARFDVRLVLPEGWAFFTRDPKDDRMLPMIRGDGARWIRASRTPNFQPRNFFGIDRAARAQGVELGLLLEEAQEAERLACEEEPENCLERMPVAQRLHNRSPNPTLCGQVGIVFQKGVPWAWSRSNQEKKITMPSKILKVDVEC